MSVITTAIAGMETEIVAGVAAVVGAGIGLKVIPMGIRFLSKVWRAITA